MIRPYAASSSSSSNCPFQVLGIIRSSKQTDVISYAEVKAAFVKLALVHHPDTAAAATAPDSNKKKDHNADFAKIRHAFESIRNDNGRAVLVHENAAADTREWTSSADNESLEAWFHRQTGEQLSFYMNVKTIREVKHVANNMSRGGLDKGGLWAMAETMAARAHERENIDEYDEPLQVTSGGRTMTIRNDNGETSDATSTLNASTRRRRRRRPRNY